MGGGEPKSFSWPKAVTGVSEGILEEVNLDLRREDYTWFGAVEQEFQVREVGAEGMLWGVKRQETCTVTPSIFSDKPPQTTASYIH